MAVNLSPVGGAAAQFFDNSGNVLTGGKLYTYLAGTTTPAVTYTTNSGITAHSNPIVLNAAGRVPDSGEIWLTDGILYKFVLKDSNDVQIATWDNIDGINSNFIAYATQDEVQTATQGQTVFTLATIQYTPATDNLSVFVNGSKQILTLNYIETSSTVVTFVDGLNVGDVVEFTTASPVATNVVNAANVSYNEGDIGAVDRNVESKLQEIVSVKDFGAVGNGVTDDTSAFQDAVATGQPIYVPFTADFYSVTALTAEEIAALYGPGRIEQSGTLIWISSSANPLSNEAAGLSYVNADFQPTKWSSVDGSLRNGAKSVTVTRTGGFGSYGLNLTEYLVTAELPAGQFDVGQTAWVSATDLNGGQVFGAWFGANTPNSELSQAYVSGAIVGMEINAGNRWGDFGLQSDIGATRYTVGLQIVPDVLPAQDGAYTTAFPGSFGLVIGQSVHNHKWWVATLLRTDAVMPDGIAHVQNGGSTALLAPNTWAKVAQYWTYGIDFGSGTFATAPINIPNSATSTTATAGGVGTLPPGVQGYLKIAVGGVVCKVPYYNN